MLKQPKFLLCKKLFCQKLLWPGSLFIFLILVLIYVNHNNDYGYYDENGKKLESSVYQGKWVVLNYWASWCRPCQEEMPELNTFYKVQQMNQVIVFGINFDQLKGEQLKSAIKQMNIKFPVLSQDPAKQLGIDAIPGLPTTFIISPEGKLVKTLFGPQTQKTLENALRSKKS